jgi:hypothetical protein
MQESPENNLPTEDSICLSVFNVFCEIVRTLTCVGSDCSRQNEYIKMAPNVDR